MKLITSKPSPYGRRIRMWLQGTDVEWVDADYLTPEGRDALRQHTPAMKVPVLIDGEQSIYDSRVIYNYLSDKQQVTPLSWEQQNTLTLIDAVNDSLVILLIMQRSGLDTSEGVLIATLQRDRIAQTLPVLESKVAAGEFRQWDYPAICLYSLLDWVKFRELYDLGPFNALQSFLQANVGREAVTATDPRQD